MFVLTHSGCEADPLHYRHNKYVHKCTRVSLGGGDIPFHYLFEESYISEVSQMSNEEVLFILHLT